MKKRNFVPVLFFVLIISTTSAWSPENCKSCHSDAYQMWGISKHAESLNAIGSDDEACMECHLELQIKQKWGRKDLDDVNEPITCEICHFPPEGGYEVHSIDPAGARPEVNLSAEMCGNCHTDEHHPTIDEWDEYSKEGFDAKTMTSHSRPADRTEDFILKNGKACMVCKSTEGAILNLAKTDILDFNEALLPELSQIRELRITCTACHDPHTTSLRIEDRTLLCANCHTSNNAQPDGSTTWVHSPQWEMFKDSGFMTGVHPEKINCVDCHMVVRPFNENTLKAASTGHSFAFDAEQLSNTESTNECHECHAANPISTIEEKQVLIEKRLKVLRELKGIATAALEEFNGTSAYDQHRTEYNNAVFYLEMVEKDGSLGVHNMGLTLVYLDLSNELFYKVVFSEKSSKQMPGFNAIITASVLLSALYLFRRILF